MLLVPWMQSSCRGVSAGGFVPMGTVGAAPGAARAEGQAWHGPAQPSGVHQRSGHGTLGCSLGTQTGPRFQMGSAPSRGLCLSSGCDLGRKVPPPGPFSISGGDQGLWAVPAWCGRSRHPPAVRGTRGDCTQGAGHCRVGPVAGTASSLDLACQGKILPLSEIHSSPCHGVTSGILESCFFLCFCFWRVSCNSLWILS